MSDHKKLDDFTAQLIKDINKERGDRIAYNLKVDASPTHINRWISTGSKLLDYICANQTDGGLPEGRIVEIFGPPSIGKSHLAAQICRHAQRMGGLAVYIDSETAVSVENLEQLGVDVNRGFVYVNEHCTENILSIAESTIHKARKFEKDVPFVIVWDSVAASSPKAELEGEYDKDSIGLQARAISKGMRKITGIIGNQNVLFVILNQTRSKIGAWSPTGDAQTTPGGKAIPFHSSIRIQLGAGSQIKDNNRVKGIHVWAKTIKNKVAPPFRKIEFEIHFGVGIKEHEQVFDLLRKHCDKKPVLIDGQNIILEGAGAWKSLKVWDPSEGDDYKKVKRFIVDKKFNKSKFDNVMNDPEFKPYIDDLLDRAMIEIFEGAPDIDFNSNIEVESAMDMIGENL